MDFSVDDLSSPATVAFLDAHISEVRAVTPPESQHALDPDELRAPGITFWTGIEDGWVAACGAVKRLDDSHAEIKSMRVAPERRGCGLASLLLRHLTAEAQRMGFVRLSLETGSSEFFEPARRLYLKHGFQPCEPFGDYRHDPNSVYLTKKLQAGGPR